MLKKLSILLSVCALSIILLACGNNNADDDDAEENEPEIVEEIDDDIETETLEDETENDEEETVDPLAADNERFVTWLESVVTQIEEINIESNSFFIAALGGLVHGTRTTIEDGDVIISAYLNAQIENTLEFIEGISLFVAERFDDETLDLVEIRDTMINAMNSMIETITEELN